MTIQFALLGANKLLKPLGTNNRFMRLQKQLSVKRGSKSYYKYLVIVPNELVQKLGWAEGQELIAEMKGRMLIVKPA